MMNRRMLVVAAGAAALSLVLPGRGRAQDAPAGKPGAGRRGVRGGRRGTWLQDTLAKLKLTPEQRTKVDKLMAESRAQVRKIRQGNGTPEETAPKLRAAMRARRQRLNAILTPQQQAQLRQAMRERRDAMKKAAGATGA